MKTTTRVYSSIQQAVEALRSKGFQPILTGEDAGRVWKRVRDGVLSTATVTSQGATKMRVSISTPEKGDKAEAPRRKGPQPVDPSRLPQPIQGSADAHPSRPGHP